MRHIEGSVTTRDGITLFTQSWIPENETIGRVLLVHGMGEHSSRYHHVARILTEAGLRVDSFDHRGHGRSTGTRGHSPAYARLLDDVNLMLEQNDTSPVFLYGHSMGGNIVLNYGLQEPPVSGIIATGPWLKLTDQPPAALILFARLMSAMKPDLTLNSGLDADGLSHDPDLNQAYREDPLVHPKISVKHFTGIVDAGSQVIEQANTFTAPLLLIHGEKDPICDPEGSREFYQACSSEDKMLEIWPNLFHEVHNEPEKDQVIGTIRDWIQARL